MTVEDLEGRRLPSRAVEPLIALPTTDPLATRIISGPGGDLWMGVSPIAGTGAATIDRVGPDGSVTAFVVPGDVMMVTGVANGPDGNVWFIADTNPDAGGNSQVLVGKVTPAGEVTEFPPIPAPTGDDGTSFGAQIVGGPGGDVWFSYAVLGSNPQAFRVVSQDFIGRVTPSGAVTLFPVSTYSSRTWGMYSLAAGADGDLWFTQAFGQHFVLERMSPSGGVTRVPVDVSPRVAMGVAGGPGRSLILTAQGLDLEHQGVFRVSTTGAVSPDEVPATHSSAFAVFLGPADGSLWFTNDTGTKRLLGRIANDGTVTTYNLSGAVPGRETEIQSMVVGPDRKLYLLAQENNANTLYRLSPGRLPPVSGARP